MTFDEAFEKLLGHEGGYVDDRADPGGETKYGISKRAYPAEDIRNLTLDRAKLLYFRDYWGPAGCDALPPAMRLQVFDMAVNSGVRAAIKALQKAAGENVDGVLGPLTLLAVQSMPAPRLVARFNGARLALMADLPQWPSFGRGWARRIAANLEDA
jgi:lysozyme family protein